jgi:hypothetical protein
MDDIITEDLLESHSEGLKELSEILQKQVKD